MAVGFKLSDVIAIDVIEDANSIIFTTKFIVYELKFDDEDKVKDLSKIISRFARKKSVKKKVEDLPDFYIGRKEK